MRAIGPQQRFGTIPCICRICDRDFLAKSTQCRTCPDEACQREAKRRETKARNERRKASAA